MELAILAATVAAILAFLLGLYWNRQRSVKTEDMTFWPVLVPDEEPAYYPETLVRR